MEKKPGRPRIQTNDELILRLRDEENMGWQKGAEVYRERTHQWISRDTFKRRYLEAKADSKASKSWAEGFAEELARKINERWLNQ
ncbi:hypothetical protein ACFLWY_05045 [Chloroflexota bacterium]